MQRHNDVKAEWHHLCVQALSASVVYDEPFIHIGCDVREAGANGTDPAPKLRGDTGIHGFWRRGTTAIFDVRVTDMDGKSQRGMEPLAVLWQHEKAKKKIYGPLYVTRRHTFTPLVFSVDGMRGPECAAASRRLATLFSLKCKKTYSKVCVDRTSSLREPVRSLKSKPHLENPSNSLGFRIKPRPLPVDELLAATHPRL
jgi:hypothetical protein